MSFAISGTLATTAGSGINANNPVIGYRNLLRDGVLTASSEAEDGHADNAITGTTYDYWTPTSLPATLEVELSSAQEADYAGIAAHSLAGIIVQIQYHDGSDWVTVAESIPADSRTFMLFWEPALSNRWRVRLSGSGSPSIGVAHIGKALRLQRRIYVGHTPATMSEQTEIRPNRTEGGQWVGRSVVREGGSVDISLQNLTPRWVREYFEPFRQYAKTGAWFWAWRPGDYPAEVAYCWTTDDIHPSNQRSNGMMQVSFGAQTYVDFEPHYG